MRRVLLAVLELAEAILEATVMLIAGVGSVVAFVIIAPFAMLGDAWSKRP